MVITLQPSWARWFKTSSTQELVFTDVDGDQVKLMKDSIRDVHLYVNGEIVTRVTSLN